ncbi:MAG: ABC transporter permease [Spirochaetes bacterium]|nr:ABC transporter permease [Spirochaetota bacterium]MBU1082264.1 ABC transporter permease [Spirochaetota bacterium]
MRKRSSFSKAVFIGTIVFLSLPLLVLVLYSFNESKSGSWTGFSLRWYVKLFTDSPQLWRAFGNSVIVALSSALVATMIGTLGAVAVNWYKFRLRKYLRTITFLPMILPEIIIGVSLLVFFSGIGLKLSLFTVFVAHVSFNLPFVFLLVLARLEEFDFSIIEAARDLGASETQTLLKVILPISMPGIISGFLTAVTLSLEDFVITFFVTGPGATTLPLYVYSAIRFGVSPVINALSVVMILGTVALTWSTRNFLKYIAAK